jgi:hypothetical protein
MSLHIKERVFFLALVVLVILHLDLWGWAKIGPILAGWIPYHMWYHGSLTLLVIAVMIWLVLWIWPDPPGELGERDR